MTKRVMMQVGLTLLILIVAGTISARLFQDTGEIQRGRADVAAVNANTASQVAKATDAQNNNYVGEAVDGVALLLIAGVWLIPFLYDRSQKSGGRSKRTYGVGMMTLALATVLVLSACNQNTSGVRNRVVTIGASDTAFVISAKETDQQAAFGSEALLAQKKVASKQLTLSYGRYLAEKSGVAGQQDTYAWKPDAVIYIVDRAPVARSWTAESTTGTSNTNQALKLESNEAIDFYLGITCNAQVDEVNASKFLYYYSGVTKDVVPDDAFKDVTIPGVFRSANLGVVMDNNIRNWLEPRLFSDMHSRSFNDIRLNAGTIIDKAVTDMRVEFGNKGITITGCGGQGGITPTDQKIQDSINQTYSQTQQNIRDQETAANQKAVAQANLDAQTIKNQQALSQAQNDAAVAKTKQDQDVAYQTAQADLYAKHPEYIQAILAQKWNGQSPQYVAGQNGNAPYVSVTPGK